MSEPSNFIFSSEILKSVKDGLSGIIAGSVCAVTGHPFDTVKVNMQIKSCKPSLFKIARDVYTSGGFRGFYKGLGPALSCNVLENGVLFLFYPRCVSFADYTYDKLLKSNYLNKDAEGIIVKSVGGSFASIFASLVICPTELVKCRLQALRNNRTTKINSFIVIGEIIKKDGLPGMFKGLSSTMIREFFGYFAIFGGYEVTNYLLKPLNIGSAQYMIAGGVGGSLYWVIMYPVDLVKSRTQVYDVNETRSLTYHTKQVFKNGGVRAFYNGVSPALVRAFFANAALFYTYEFCQSVLP